jgi:hypothetical protein
MRSTAWTFYTAVENIGSYILKVPATIRLHPVFYANNLRPCSTSSLRPTVPIATLTYDDEEFDISQFSVVCIKPLDDRRGNYLLFMTNFNDDDILHVWHRLYEVHRPKALQDFVRTPQWHAFAKTQACIDFICAYHVRIFDSH